MTFGFSYDTRTHSSLRRKRQYPLRSPTNGSGSEVAIYTQTRTIDETLAELRGSTTDYYEADGLGSTTSLSGSSGTVADTYTYDSFGNLTASTGTVRNYFQYTGREFDPETGIYEYRARYFDPTIGRFISGDPLRFAAGINFFAYVHNDPVGLEDPMGLCDQNCQLSISCGPTSRTEGFSHCTVTIQNGSSYTGYDGGASGSVLWSKLYVGSSNGAPPGSSSFVKNVPVPCDCAQKKANAINSSNLIYSFPIQNSNTAAAMLAGNCGVYPDSWPSGAWGSSGRPIPPK